MQTATTVTKISQNNCNFTFEATKTMITIKLFPQRDFY